MTSLYNQSIQIIKDGQSRSGAYVACPNFPTYQYSWLRDGSFIAYAMDIAGEYDSAAAFFRWVGKTIEKYNEKLEMIEKSLKGGIPIGKDDVLHTRFTLDGQEDTSDPTWGNFQIDGYGTWLWALAQHFQFTKDASLISDLKNAIEITLRYLNLVWQLPNYDCWEEFPEYIHLYSLATVYAGANSAQQIVEQGLIQIDNVPVKKLAQDVHAFIMNYGIVDGKIIKHIWPALDGAEPKPVMQSGVDASMIGLAVPYQLFPLDDPIILRTMHAVEKDLLSPGGGLYRYLKDEYYGGGEWILLTAWLGWYYVVIGQVEKAETLRGWIESKATKEGYLPEQISENLLDPVDYKPWLKRWGPVASPLLWSHAMYIILVDEIKRVKEKRIQ